MLRRSSKFARSVAVIFIIAYFAGLIWCFTFSLPAQAADRFNRVISCTQNSSGNTLILKTVLPDPIAAPALQYLTGADGKIILVADFPGLIWTLPTCLITTFSENVQVKTGIQEVRIGQFQDAPPTLRIAISSRDKMLLQKVDFSASASTLIIKLPTGSAMPDVLTDRDTRIAKPVKAPSREELYEGKSMPPYAPPIERRKTRLGREPQPIERQPQYDENSAAQDTDKGDATSGSAPILSLKKIGTLSQPVLKVDLVADRKLTFKSFRLHNPERYVVDFENLPELTQIGLPVLEDNTLLSSVRIGAPAEGCSRLVLDLPGADVQVQESLPQSTVLSLTLKKENTESEQIPKHLFIPKGTLIVLDPGHGGSDPGAQRGDVQEKEITLQIVQKLKRLLDQMGARVILTRNDDTSVSLEERVRITNNALPKVFLSIHINALESSSEIHGIETYYQTGHSKALAENVHNALVSLLKAPDRGVRKARFYVINHTAPPAILAEVGFISNKEERDKLISSDYQTNIAESLAYGVMLYLNQQSEREKGVAHSGLSNNKDGMPIIMPKINMMKHEMDKIHWRRSLPKVLPYPFLHGGKAYF